MAVSSHHGMAEVGDPAAGMDDRAGSLDGLLDLAAATRPAAWGTLRGRRTSPKQKGEARARTAHL